MLNKWSTTLVEETKSCLYNIDSFNSADGCLHLKCVDGRYGSIKVVNLIKDHLEVDVKISNQRIYFRTSEELIEAGWAID